jgi:hypothetical protein
MIVHDEPERPGCLRALRRDWLWILVIALATTPLWLAGIYLTGGTP